MSLGVRVRNLGDSDRGRERRANRRVKARRRSTQGNLLGRLLRGKSGERFVWALPFFVLLVVVLQPQKRVIELMAGLIALPLIVFLINRPGPSLVALVAILIFEPVGFPLIYALAHIPAQGMRALADYKELLAFVVIVAGFRKIRDSGRGLDKLDIALLFYVGVTTVYLIVPHLFSDVVNVPFGDRLLAWRADAGYPLVFFGARHIAMTPRARQRLTDVVVAAGAIAAAVGLFERVARTAFSNFILNTAHLSAYQTNVGGISTSNASSNLSYLEPNAPFHIVSILLSPYTAGDYFVICTAIVAVRISHNRGVLLNYVILALLLGANFFTEARSDELAALAVLILIALPTLKSSRQGRIALISALLIGATIVVPYLGDTRFFGGDRSFNAFTAVEHRNEINAGLQIIYHDPLGLGIGEQPGVANRSASLNIINDGDISDNIITQVGDELGVQALLPWLIMVAFVFLELYRRTRDDDPELARAWMYALLGVFIAGQFHQAFLTYSTTWTVWAGAGMAASADYREKSLISSSGTSVWDLEAGVR
jgi:hypothetical protein